MSDIYLDYVETSSGGEIAEFEGIDSEDIGAGFHYYEDTYMEVDFKGLRIKPKNFFDFNIEIQDENLLNNDYLYLGIIRFTSGNTFGKTHGLWHIVGVASSEEAAQKMIDHELIHAAYKPWEGYFEKFEDTEIHQLALEK